MSTALAPKPTIDPALIERVLLHGDLKQLTPQQKVSYYNAVCESVGLNPLTQPFQYLVLNGKEVLYARRDATEQLRNLHNVSIQITGREVMEDCYVVTARATLQSGRQDENIGAVPIGGLKGEMRANAMMKAETKAKRRVTLAICGLGMLDETEVESIHAGEPQGYTVTPISGETWRSRTTERGASAETAGDHEAHPVSQGAMSVSKGTGVQLYGQDGPLSGSNVDLSLTRRVDPASTAGSGYRQPSWNSTTSEEPSSSISAAQSEGQTTRSQQRSESATSGAPTATSSDTTGSGSRESGPSRKAEDSGHSSLTATEYQRTLTALPEGAVLITKVEVPWQGSKAKAKGWLFHSGMPVDTKDGWAIYDDQLLGLAHECAQNRTPVWVEPKTSAGGKTYVKGLKRAHVEAELDDEPIDDSSIPF